jgi:Domain of unknown function (DUF4126)
METGISIALGIGLSAAVGFRVFVPPLLIGVAAQFGHLVLSPGFEWMGTWPAIIAFGTATVVEILAYAIPLVDHLLDTIATPLAVIVGVTAMAAVLVDLPPMVKWILAVIGGGGIAGTVQGATVLTRIKSTTLSAGFTNPVFSALEFLGSVFTSVMAMLLPVATAMLICVSLALLFWTSGRILFGHRSLRR